MRLAATRTGPTRPQLPSLSFVHGFTQTSRSWDPVTSRLADAHECVCVDAPGHGASPDGRRTLWECGGDIADTVPPGVLVGYSMGARMALHSVLVRPAHFTGLVLVSGTAGLDDPEERRARRAADEALADRVENIGVEAFVDEWLALPMFSGLTADTAMRADRLRNSASGLADSLRWAGTGTQDPLWDRLGEVRVPVLVVTGSLDHKFVPLGERLVASIPRATGACIEGAGHSVNLERTDEFVDRFVHWLSEIASPTE